MKESEDFLRVKVKQKYDREEKRRRLVGGKNLAEELFGKECRSKENLNKRKVDILKEVRKMKQIHNRDEKETEDL